MSKTYKNGRKQNKKMLTRKRKGGFMNYLNTQIEKGKQMANKHYEDAKRIATPHAERMMNQTMNKMKPTYDKMKNSNASNYALFSMAERYGKSAMNKGMRTMKDKGNSMMEKGNSMMEKSNAMMEKSNAMSNKYLDKDSNEYLNKMVKDGKDMANKYYDMTMKVATPHAERMMNQTMNKIKPTYDKMKNSNDFYRSLFSKAEKYGNSALEQGKLRFNPNGMKPKNIEQAVNGSVAGVPQSSQYPRAQVATMSPTTV